MNILRVLLPLGIITVFFGTLYVAVEQDFRMSANDPQIELAEEVASAMSQGQSDVLQSFGRIDMRTDLSAFVMVFDETGHLTFSSARLDGNFADPPAGIFDYVRAYGEDRVTWEPSAGVRIAAVVMPYQSGFVLAGRSLRETDARIDSLSIEVGFGWALAMLLAGFYLFITRPRGLMKFLG